VRRESPIQLLKPVDGTIVDGTLIVDVTVDEVDEAVGLWSPYLIQQLQSGVAQPQHAHWEWNRKARAVLGMPGRTICGVMVGGEMQAMMLREDVWSRAKHPDELGRPIVTVEFLSTAPWNDVDIVPTPAYRGAGTILITEAVNHSLSLDYKGRLGLHSLPQAEPFYRNRCKMVDLGPDPDPDHQGLRYFEFTKETAHEFLKAQKRK
jgi:hypothetical protein